MAAPAFTPTDVREPQEVERFRAAEAGALSVPGHEAAKSDQSRLVGVKRKPEAGEPCFEIVK